MMTPELSRTAAIAVNTPGLSFDENGRLRGALIKAGEYDKLDAWAKEKYDAAHVIYLRQFVAGPASDQVPPLPSPTNRSGLAWTDSSGVSRTLFGHRA